MDVDTGIRLVVGAALVLANAFFVMSEFALTRARQLGITSSSIVLGVVAEPAVTALLEPFLGGVDLSTGTRHVTSVVLAVVAINLVRKIWGEQAPTYLGVERPRLVARYCAPALYIRRSWTREEAPEGEKGPIADPAALRREMRELLARGRVPEDRRREVVAALEIGERPVSEVMVPRDEIVALRADRVVGLVTSTDAFEAIAGELEDPLDVKMREEEEG